MRNLLLALTITLFLSTTASAQYSMFPPQLSHGQGYNSSYQTWDLGWNLGVEARRQAMILRAYSGAPTYNYYQAPRTQYYPRVRAYNYYGRNRWNGRRYGR